MTNLINKLVISLLKEVSLVSYLDCLKALTTNKFRGQPMDALVTSCSEIINTSANIFYTFT